MYTLRTFGMPALALAAALAVGTAGTASASAAKPTKPGGVTGLAATVTPHQEATYSVDASWNAVSNATSYRVNVVKGGVTLATATVTTNAWSPTFASSPGTGTLSVRAVAKRQPGKATSISIPLLDVTAPSGTYSSDWDNSTGHATITQDSLTDNAPVAGVTRTVDWNDGTSPEAWASGTTLGHDYPTVENRYAPTVTLEDAAHNITVVDVPAVVIKDTSAPTGTFSNDTATAWAKFTQVSVSQSAIHDDWTPDNLIARSIDWGDGTTSAWTSGMTAKHVYTTAGSFAPTVTVTDEAHNATAYPLAATVVSLDSVGPVVKLTLPRSKHSVKAWRTLRGTATDAATGVKKVLVKAVELRSGQWFGYNAKTHRWVKAATKAKAYAAAKAVVTTTDGSHRWSATLSRLTKGTLVYKAWALDQVGNRSAVVRHKTLLTKR